VGTGAATGRATTTARSGLDVAASGSESATSQRSKLLLNVVDDSFEGLDGSQRSKLLLNEVDDSFEGLDVSFDIYSVYTVEVKKKRGFDLVYEAKSQQKWAPKNRENAQFGLKIMRFVMRRDTQRRHVRGAGTHRR